MPTDVPAKRPGTEQHLFDVFLTVPARGRQIMPGIRQNLTRQKNFTRADRVHATDTHTDTLIL